MASAALFGTITATAGTKTRGTITVTHNLDGSPVEIPVVVVNGTKPGRRVWLFCGIHGDEIEAIRAVQRFVADIDPDRLTGSVVAMLAANPSAVAACARESTEDGKDLNRVFPGDPAGSFTDRLAHMLFSHIAPVLDQDDVLFNLHGGGRTVLSANLIELRGTADEAEQRSFELAQMAVNPNLRIISRIDEREGPWAKTYRGTLMRELYLHTPIARLTLECGGMGRLRAEDIQAHYDAFANVMKGLDMIEGDPVRPGGEVIHTVENVRVMPSHRGLWLQQVDVGAPVSRDQVVAEVVDIYGDTVEQLRSPFDGLVLYTRGHGTVDPLSYRLGDRYGTNIARHPDPRAASWAQKGDWGAVDR